MSDKDTIAALAREILALRQIAEDFKFNATNAGYIKMVNLPPLSHHAQIAEKERRVVEALRGLCNQFAGKLSIGSIDNIMEARVYREEIEQAWKLLSDLEALKEANK